MRLKSEILIVGSDVEKIVVGVDPQPAKTMDNRGNPNGSGLIVAVINAEGRYYILEDFSVNGTPDEWVKAVQNAYAEWDIYDMKDLASLIGPGDKEIDQLLNKIDDIEEQDLASVEILDE